MNGILAQVGSNLKASTQVTDSAFSTRIGEVKRAKGKLEEQKAETVVKIQEIESTLQSLEQAIMAKQGPLATCQAKIHQRRLRPGAEYCHDEVDDHLAREQRNLLEIINKLEAGLGQVRMQCKWRLSGDHLLILHCYCSSLSLQIIVSCCLALLSK